MADYLSGEGCTLEVDVDGAGAGTFAVVGKVISMTGPTRAVAEVEWTHLGSAAKRFRASKIPEGGTVGFTITFDPDDPVHESLEDLMTTPVTAKWRMTLTDAVPTTYSFDGILTGFELGGMEVESNITADLTIRIDGLPTKA